MDAIAAQFMVLASPCFVLLMCHHISPTPLLVGASGHLEASDLGAGQSSLVVGTPSSGVLHFATARKQNMQPNTCLGSVGLENKSYTSKKLTHTEILQQSYCSLQPNKLCVVMLSSFRSIRSNVVS